jgi:hypothetical protein
MFVEMWSSNTDRYRRSLEILNDLEFDCVFVNLSSCLPRLRTVLRRPCDFLPLGVDALRFAPYGNAPARVIDYYSLGRRSDVTHKALMEFAARRGAFYFFDSAVRYQWNDCFDHRILTANLLQRTRYLMAHKPSLRTDQDIGDDEALSARLFEGAGAGAILIGVPPSGPDFEENFNWPDAVISAPFECREIGELIDGLEKDPDRIASARRNNIVQSLMRHDWSYRWQTILQTVRLNALPNLGQRQSELRQIAGQVAQANTLEALA